MKNKIFIISMLSLLIFGMSFTTQKPLSKNYNKKWKLVELSGFSLEKLQKTQPYVDLSNAKRASAKVACNQMFFSYKVKNKHQIKISQVASTLMYCNENMDLEKKFSELLPTMDYYEVSGHFLILKNKKGEIIKFTDQD